jgi:L-malate glycosyltransferase
MRTQQLLRVSDYMADAVVVNCEAMRQYMINDEGMVASRVELCYNGVVTAEFYPVENAVRPDVVASASLVIGTVCVLRPEKDLQLLEEAFARVRHLKTGMKLLIVGSGPDLEKLQDNAARLGITDAMVFVPATRDVANWLRAMDIFVLPSYSEAFSNSLLEAMACGCSVVGSRVGGTPELIGANEERGFLFESRNAEDLAKKLSLLITDDGLRRALASRAACFAREDLSSEIAAQTTAAIYDKLLERKTGLKSTPALS